MIKINGRTISVNNPPYIIGEMSANHNGKINLVFKLIDRAASVGADYIKFQHTNPNLISPFAKKAKYQLENTKSKIYGVQFHPESIKTKLGIKILKNLREMHH